jgi:hypothetical protein
VTLADFLKENNSGDPPGGTVGVESDWLDVGTLQVTTGSLWAGDPYVCNANCGCLVKVPAGTYVLMAKAMDFAGRKRVSRLRVLLQTAGKPVLGKKVGEADIDTARMAVCDIAAVDDAIGDDHGRFDELITQHEYGECGVVEFRMKKPIAMPYVDTGFGDGSYPVFELRSRWRRVGTEMEFLPAGFKYEDTDNDALVFPPEEVDCASCGGTGKCYCLRKGAGTAAGCVRCGGSGTCRVCGGKGKIWREVRCAWR